MKVNVAKLTLVIIAVLALAVQSAFTQLQNGGGAGAVTLQCSGAGAPPVNQDRGLPGKRGIKGERGEKGDSQSRNGEEEQQQEERKFKKQLGLIRRELTSGQSMTQLLQKELNATQHTVETLARMFEDYRSKSEFELYELTRRIGELEAASSGQNSGNSTGDVRKIRSCKDVLRNGNSRDGIYRIQPSDSLPAFNVNCRFSGNTAITAIGHDTESKTEVPVCGPPKCYQKIINYEATMPQMRALIDNLGSCRQYVKYDCYGSMMFGDLDAGWQAWNGVMRHYWGGADGREGYCACGVEENCDDSSRNCNCDKNDAVWREDSGYLDQQNDLPVATLYFADTDQWNEMGHHTLGQLECIEQVEQVETARSIRSCSDVREVNGNATDGVYQVQPSDSLPPFDVHCRFSGDSTAITSIGHDTEAETEVPTCTPQKCYQKIINYEATMPQMRALIDYLGSCRQYVKYDCYGSMMFGDLDAGWQAWNGVMRHYWGGADGREGYCACGVEDNCADRTRNCNCDKNDEVWREDSGYLTQQNDLPVSTLYFGDTDQYNEMGRHTLGRLECIQ